MLPVKNMNMKFLPAVLFFGTGFEVLTVMSIHNVIWVRLPYNLVHMLVCVGGAFWVYLHRQSEDGGNTS
jgi:hypothetical protein